ncbi:MAG: class I SAM-dependent methyltransferase [Anaerolineae bacterium]|nr:class I SAM-dependent methyltransferase [Anaerolineae bacterium]
MSYVYMKVLESSPGRYERGMGVLTLGRWEQVQRETAGRVGTGERVLDVGCGTGALASKMARRGAKVTAIDVSSAMLAQAAERLAQEGLAEGVALREMGVAELDVLPDSAFDVVTSVLVLSELSNEEMAYALAEFRRLLRPGGRLLIADEVLPGSVVGRVATWLVRLPFAIAAFLLTQTMTHRVSGLRERMAAAGFDVVEEKGYLAGTLRLFVARV